MAKQEPTEKQKLKNLTSQVDRLLKNLEQCYKEDKEKILLCQDLAAKLLKEGFSLYYNGMSVQRTVITIEELRILKKATRRILGNTWKPKMIHVNVYGPEWVEAYLRDNETFPLVQITLRTTIADFPASLKGPSCKFKSRSQSGTVWSYVCEKPEDQI
jgi:hypothetical protein